MPKNILVLQISHRQNMGTITQKHYVNIYGNRKTHSSIWSLPLVALHTNRHWEKETEAPAKSGVLSHNGRDEYRTANSFRSNPKYANT